MKKEMEKVKRKIKNPTLAGTSGTHKLIPVNKKKVHLMKKSKSQQLVNDRERVSERKSMRTISRESHKRKIGWSNDIYFHLSVVVVVLL